MGFAAWDGKRRGFARQVATIGLAACLILFSAASGLAQYPVVEFPENCSFPIDINQIIMRISNYGDISWGSGLTNSCLNGELTSLPRGEYPKDSKQGYFGWTDYWLGAIVGGDTMALAGPYSSGGFLNYQIEMFPDESPFGRLEYRSTLDPESPNFDGAISEQDYYGQVTDRNRANTNDPVTNRYNKRMYAQFDFFTHAWSYGYAEDFILVNLRITNIGELDWKEAYVGVAVIGSKGKYVCDSCYAENFSGMIGLLQTRESASRCGGVDTFNLIWSASNDGQPIDGEYILIPRYDPITNSVRSSAPNVAGVMPLRQFDHHTKRSYNWWGSRNPFITEDFGPRGKQNFRDFRNGNFAFPFGQKNVYHVLSNGEIDFDQAYTGLLNSSNPNWVHTNEILQYEIADGASTSQIISFGPFDIQPGATVDFPFAIVAGEHFHHDPNNLKNNIPNNPNAYMTNLDFSDLTRNALWAQWIYDNPGVDTDSDGYAGQFRVCVTESVLVDSSWVPAQADTTWYRGDGVPDWRAAGPPPAPYVWLYQTLNGIRVRFNGERSETEKDIFTHVVDFEGYRVYWGRDPRRTNLSVIASYDLENYDKWTLFKALDDDGVPRYRYEIRQMPYTLAQLRCLYGSGNNPCNDDSFQPLTYTSFAPLVVGDSVFYFSKHERNVSELGISTPIRKRFPNVRDPRTIPVEELNDDDYTDDGHLRFFEYEMEIPDLLPTVPYWVNVTAFDFGSPESGLEALETSATLNVQDAYPAASEDELADDDLNAYVYPNPYRIDDSYRSDGYEGRTRDDFPNDKVRAINFANLPYKCTIKVFTLDGDLVVEKQHDADPSDPSGRHDYWSLINRNRQIIVSGLYYWTVEEPSGRVQMGKFVVLR